MMETTVTRRVEWDAAHRVMRHESKCATLHGHRYVALIELSAEKLDDTDRVIDFGVVKEIVGGWVNEKWDHTALLNSEDYSLYDFCMHEVMTGGKRPPYTFDKQEPTAEVIARELFEVSVSLLMDHGVKVVSVTVFETPNCSARFGMKP